MLEKSRRVFSSRRLKLFLFFLFFGIAVLTAKNIVLPYSNPLGVSGPLTEEKLNPLNNIVRFLFIVFFPFFAYLAVILLNQFLAIFFGSSKEEKKAIAKRDNPEEIISGSGASTKKLDKILLLILFVLFLFVYLGYGTYKNPPLDTFHEGETLGTAVDFQSGKKPYTDTIFLHGVFQDPLRTVIAFKLFGMSIASERLMASMLGILSFLLFFITIFVLFNFEIIYGVFSGAILFLLFNVYYTLPFRDVFTFIPVIFIGLFYKFFIKHSNNQSSAQNNPLFFFFLAFTPLFVSTATFAHSIDRGFYSFFGVIVFSVVTLILFFNEKKAFRLFILSAALGFALGLIVIFIAVRGAIYDFYKFSFEIMPLYKDLMDGFVYRFDGRNLVPVALFSVIIFWIGNRFLLYISENKSVKFFDKVKNFLVVYYMEIFLLSFSLAFFRGALGRGDLGHIIDASAPIFLTIIYISVKNYIGPNQENSKVFYSITFIVLLVAVINTFSKYESYKNRNWWKFATDISDEQLIPENYKKTIKFLKKNLEKDEYFITLTSEGTWYYFVNKPCPIKFPIIWFASNEIYQKEIVSQLEDKKGEIKYIVYSNNHWGNNFDFIPNKKRFPILFEYIGKNYGFYKKIDDQEIWEIKK